MTCFGCPAYILGYTPTDRGVKVEWECKLNLAPEDKECPRFREGEDE
jgi:hypothetical protein